MDGKLAEAVLLTSHARVALAGVLPFALNLSHSAFKYTSSLRFELDSGAAADAASVVATSPEGWFEYLQSSGVHSLALRSGAMICVSGAAPERAWQQTSDLVKPRPADGRIWAVRYQELKVPPAGSELDVDGATARLVEVVEACEALARDAKENGWSAFFGRARSEMKPEPGSPLQQSNLLPPRGYSDAAQRLLRGCELAWALGGMGSWNDLYLEDHELARRYDRVTPQLSSALHASVPAAVNSALCESMGSQVSK